MENEAEKGPITIEFQEFLNKIENCEYFSPKYKVNIKSGDLIIEFFAICKTCRKPISINFYFNRDKFKDPNFEDWFYQKKQETLQQLVKNKQCFECTYLTKNFSYDKMFNDLRNEYIFKVNESLYRLKAKLCEYCRSDDDIEDPNKFLDKEIIIYRRWEISLTKKDPISNRWEYIAEENEDPNDLIGQLNSEQENTENPVQELIKIYKRFFLL
jgi:hypothetical protein